MGKNESNENPGESAERNLQSFDDDFEYDFTNERKYFDELYFRNSKLFKM